MIINKMKNQARGLFLAAFLALMALPQSAHARLDIVLGAADSVVEDSSEHKNLKPLARLKLKLKKEGYDISNYLQDKRFFLYNDIKKIRTRTQRTVTEEQYWKNLANYVKNASPKALEFMLDNDSALIKAEKKYGVDSEYLVSILNKETKLGNYLGSRIAFNTLVSLYHFLPEKRHKGFNTYEQLKALIRLSKKENQDIFSYKGSYMAALGISQFLPSNIEVFGVDFDEDGKVDLYSREDAIGSAANFLSHFGFKENKRKAILTYNYSSVYLNYIEALAKNLEVKYAEVKGIKNGREEDKKENKYSGSGYSKRAPTDIELGL